MRAAAADGIFFMQGDAAQELRLAVEEDLRALDFDGPETDAVRDRIAAARDLHVVQARALGRPERELARGDLEFGDALRVRETAAGAHARNLDGDLFALRGA